MLNTHVCSVDTFPETQGCLTASAEPCPCLQTPPHPTLSPSHSAINHWGACSVLGTGLQKISRSTAGMSLGLRCRGQGPGQVQPTWHSSGDPLSHRAGLAQGRAPELGEGIVILLP